MNKIQVRPEIAFCALDTNARGTLTIEDFREFLRSQNMYPIEKNLQLMYERFNKSETGFVDREEFTQGVKPFLQGIN